MAAEKTIITGRWMYDTFKISENPLQPLIGVRNDRKLVTQEYLQGSRETTSEWLTQTRYDMTRYNLQDYWPYYMKVWKTKNEHKQVQNKMQLLLNIQIGLL